MENQELMEISTPFLEYTVQKTIKVKDLINNLDIKKYLAILVDGKKVDLNTEIYKGQRIIILPLIAGGQ